jgi:hypothetical protein
MNLKLKNTDDSSIIYSPKKRLILVKSVCLSDLIETFSSTLVASVLFGARWGIREPFLTPY